MAVLPGGGQPRKWNVNEGRHQECLYVAPTFFTYDLCTKLFRLQHLRRGTDYVRTFSSDLLKISQVALVGAEEVRDGPLLI